MHCLSVPCKQGGYTDGESRECFSVKDNDNGEGTDKVLRIEKNRSDNYPQKESSDP
jgi:hypothetical protein